MLQNSWLLSGAAEANPSGLKVPFHKQHFPLQFRGAFKRFVKSRSEKDMERRWTRINKNNIAEISKGNANGIESSMLNTNGERIHFDLRVDKPPIKRRPGKKLRFDVYSEVTSRSMDNLSFFTYQPTSCSEIRKSFPCNLDSKYFVWYLTKHHDLTRFRIKAKKVTFMRIVVCSQ